MAKQKSKQNPSSIFKNQIPALDALYEGAINQLNQSSPLSPVQEMANQMKLDYTSKITPYVDNIQSVFQNILNPKDASGNPYLNQAIGAALRPIKQAFSENTMSGITDEANMAGQHGGPRQGIAEGIAQRGLQDTIADVSSKMAFDDYNNQMQRQLQAFGLAPAMVNLGMMPLEMMSQVGTQQQNAPWSDLMRYSQIIGSPTVLGGGGSSRGGTTSAIGNLFS